MGDIYKQAKKVYIWVGQADGQEDGDVAKTFTLFRKISVRQEYTVLREDTVRLELERVQTQVQKFLARPWFFRRWTLQEAKLAEKKATMLCGQNAIDWRLFVSACQLLRPHMDDYGAQAMSTLIRTVDEADDIPSLLFKFHRSDCSEKKDRIAALLGLVPVMKRPTFDYSESHRIMYERCAVELAQSHFSHYLLMHLFSFGACRRYGDTDIPSWVPNWSRTRQYIPTLSGILKPGYANEFYDYTQYASQQCKAHHKAKELAVTEFPYSQQECWYHEDLTKSWYPFVSKNTHGCGFATANTCIAHHSSWARWIIKRSAPMTLLSSFKDETGRPILRVTWCNYWGNLYGQTILKVAVAPTPGTEPIMPGQNLGYLLSLQSSIDFEGNHDHISREQYLFSKERLPRQCLCEIHKSLQLEKLSFLTQHFMVNQGSKTLLSLSKEEQKQEIRLAFYTFFASKSRSRFSGLHGNPRPSILVELTEMLQKSNLTIAVVPGIRGSDQDCFQPDFIIGSTCMTEGMTVIPLRSWWSPADKIKESAAYRVFEVSGKEMWRRVKDHPHYRCLWAATSKQSCVEYLETTSICTSLVVKPLDTAHVSSAPSDPLLAWEDYSKGTRELMTRVAQASYVGSCLGVVPPDSERPTGHRVAGFRMKNWVCNNIDSAQREGQPCPFMMDII
ncbi:hypothetical protein F5Y18DRAFT_373723 [Xylariaceae sp. FL1019]|nr:hypothetical protein F5Y18DRAFT_373723 [Xylariaceae sp. FL1019]